VPEGRGPELFLKESPIQQKKEREKKNSFRSSTQSEGASPTDIKEHRCCRALDSSEQSSIDKFLKKIRSKCADCETLRNRRGNAWIRWERRRVLSHSTTIHSSSRSPSRQIYIASTYDKKLCATNPQKCSTRRWCSYSEISLLKATPPSRQPRPPQPSNDVQTPDGNAALRDKGPRREKRKIKPAYARGLPAHHQKHLNRAKGNKQDNTPQELKSPIHRKGFTRRAETRDGL